MVLSGVGQGTGAGVVGTGGGAGVVGTGAGVVAPPANGKQKNIFL